MSSNIRIPFGNRVRKLRQAQGISQEELAFSSDLHRTYISDIERGARNVSLDNINKIAIALDVAPKDLFDF
ncbi:helix-turn-helix domain-containing protein [Desulfosporosinus sp. BICA1-9]|uniref:helix-turn-helix domain-containing protein n=1 Tax=Desulfosporosinus sp. BICA1-9 TaxID=1531958 RepID=UPI00054B627C|nr:helix-turn-helix transcriptional regulator [Desulfosporosinus sp. BICA1-9]KJS90239.1 MAG: XRE family transcriptional regulator [Desulfosporosinus sp. BICA1-9]HBW39021.1 XRE family transcriptional regulator [Desulfosporosinus sp.]